MRRNPTSEILEAKLSVLVLWYTIQPLIVKHSAIEVFTISLMWGKILDILRRPC